MKSYLMVPFSWPILCVVQGKKHVSFVHTSHEFVVYSNSMGPFNVYPFLGGFVKVLASIKWFFNNISAAMVSTRLLTNHAVTTFDSFFINKFLAEATAILFHFFLCWERVSTRSLCVQNYYCPNFLVLLQIAYHLRQWKVIVKKQLMLELIQIVWES